MGNTMNIPIPVFEGTFPKSVSATAESRAVTQCSHTILCPVFIDTYVECVLHPVDEEKCEKKLAKYNAIREILVPK